MSVELKHFDIKDDWQEIRDQIDEDGGVIVKNYIPEELLQRIIQELKPHADGFETWNRRRSDKTDLLWFPNKTVYWPCAPCPLIRGGH